MCTAKRQPVACWHSSTEWWAFGCDLDLYGVCKTKIIIVNRVHEIDHLGGLQVCHSSSPLHRFCAFFQPEPVEPDGSNALSPALINVPLDPEVSSLSLFLFLCLWFCSWSLPWRYLIMGITHTLVNIIVPGWYILSFSTLCCLALHPLGCFLVPCAITGFQYMCSFFHGVKGILETYFCDFLCALVLTGQDRCRWLWSSFEYHQVEQSYKLFARPRVLVHWVQYRPGLTQSH